MARKRVNLQWIVSDSSRRATYQRRCQRLLKKSGELATLCRVNVCVVAYGGEGVAAPGAGAGAGAGAAAAQAPPDVWPAPAEAAGLLARFRDMPDVPSLKKSQSQEAYLGNRIKKLRDRVGKLDVENRRREAALLLHESMQGRRPGLDGTSADELAGLRELVDKRLSEAEERFKVQQQLGAAAAAAGQQEGAHQVPPPPPAAAPSSSQMPQQAAASDPFLSSSEMQALLAPAEGVQLQPLREEDLLADLGMSIGGDLGAAPVNDFTFQAGPGEGSSSAMTPGGFPWK